MCTWHVGSTELQSWQHYLGVPPLSALPATMPWWHQDCAAISQLCSPGTLEDVVASSVLSL